MNPLIAFTLVIAGIIHLLPLSGVLGGARLAALYGIPVDDPNTVILLRHRAVLFALLGALLVGAAFQPDLQRLAFGAGLVSTASFLAVAALAGGYNRQVGRVVRADVVALVLLAGGAATLFGAGR